MNPNNMTGFNFNQNFNSNAGLGVSSSSSSNAGGANGLGLGLGGNIGGSNSMGGGNSMGYYFLRLLVVLFVFLGGMNPGMNMGSFNNMTPEQFTLLQLQMQQQQQQMQQQQQQMRSSSANGVGGASGLNTQLSDWRSSLPDAARQEAIMRM